MNPNNPMPSPTPEGSLLQSLTMGMYIRTYVHIVHTHTCKFILYIQKDVMDGKAKDLPTSCVTSSTCGIAH